MCAVTGLGQSLEAWTWSVGENNSVVKVLTWCRCGVGVMWSHSLRATKLCIKLSRNPRLTQIKHFYMCNSHGLTLYMKISLNQPRRQTFLRTLKCFSCSLMLSINNECLLIELKLPKINSFNGKLLNIRRYLNFSKIFCRLQANLFLFFSLFGLIL